ncbi:MAG: hypothetical protein LBK99_00480 [Opitutaceae bacterium]|jgi:uroporphyrinogen decarboxylase|nr:hypothetical protein [Opitutaceae bacterium]
MLPESTAGSSLAKPAPAGRTGKTAPPPRGEIESALRCEPGRKTPLFLPAIYEHKAWFVGDTPSVVSRDSALLIRALLAEYEALAPDALTVGLDVYNIEAEAAGCAVTYYENGDTSVPSIASHIIGEETTPDDLKNAPLPDPLKDGRMPVNLAAAREVRRIMGGDLWLRCAISGPFSLAISLAGAEAVFMGCLENPEWARGVLSYAGRIIRIYARACIDAGAGLVIFDSQASPDLIAPSLFREFVLPELRDLVSWANTQGVRDVPLVIGGNTTPIAELLVQTGANNLLSDFTTDIAPWIEVCRRHKRALRRNISPRLIESQTPDRIYETAMKEAALHKDFPGLIMGTGVIPYGTPTENLLAIRQACAELLMTNY